MRVPIAFVLSVMLSSTAAFANLPPDAPIINEPAIGNLINPEDVHMEAQEFFDPDPNDGHLCTDWEIWRISPSERVWVTSCISGVERLHTHLGDGAFENSHAGRTGLFHDENYQLRVRFRDDSGDPGTEWSAWSSRNFLTGPPTQTYALELDDVLSVPAPTWTTSAGPVVLSGGENPPALILDSPLDDLFLQMTGTGSGVAITNPAGLNNHQPVRLRILGGQTGLALTESDLAISFAGLSQPLTIYLPALGVPSGQEAVFWIAASGATYYGAPGQTEPDFSNLGRGVSVPWEVLAPGYRVDVVATGFQLPVNIAFVPDPGDQPNDPYYYVSELYGKIKVVTRGGQVSDYASGLINFPSTGAFPGSGEQGLAGVVVDPSNGDVYATRLTAVPAPNGSHFPQVIRLPSNDGGLTASTVEVVLHMPGEVQGQSHQISNISFGPDDKLYVHNGDGFVASTAQNMDSYRGKMLRMNRDGTPAADNPFYNPGDGINSRDYIIAWGLRNPFGGAWRAADARHYTVENGPSIDRITFLVPGRNYLWLGDDPSMLNFALYNWQPAAGPVNIAFIEPETFGASGFPEDQWDYGFVSESGSTYATGPSARNKSITRFLFDQNGDLVGDREVFARYVGTGKATVAGLAAGPDGLYFSDLYKDQGYTSPIDPGANILRIRYVGRAEFSAETNSGPQAPFATRFIDQSDVPGATQWFWDFGDGQTSTQQNPIHVYDAPGIYDVRLTVVSPTAGARLIEKPGFILVDATGLIGQYYDNEDFTALALTRTDPQINFQWGGGAPDPGMGANQFSVRWTGKVTPLFSQTYTFYTTTDDGVRLWVNDQLIVDHWFDQGPTERSGTIALVAGQPVNLRMDYYENGGGAVAELRWSSASQAKQIIPAPQFTQSFAPADLQVQLGASADPALAGQPLAYSAIVSNESPDPASGVRVQVDLPAGFAATVLTPADDCWNTPGGIECYLGALAGGAQAEVTIDGVLDQDAQGQLAASATVVGNELDPNALNDAATREITVLRAPLFTLDPVGLSACAGDNVTLTVAVAGYPTPTLQWRRDGQPIPGQTGATLQLSPIDPNQAGAYDVVATNAADSVTSLPATITVAPTQPFITKGPRSSLVTAGDAVTLNATVAGANIAYQWRRDGQPIPGADSASLILNPVQVADAGLYELVATNACGSVTSSPARLRVLERRGMQNVRP